MFPKKSKIYFFSKSHELISKSASEIVRVNRPLSADEVSLSENKKVAFRRPILLVRFALAFFFLFFLKSYLCLHLKVY